MPRVFMDGPWKMAMGLNALDTAQWLWRDAQHGQETAERRALMREKPGLVLACLPGAEAACLELLELGLEWLEQYEPGTVQRLGQQRWHDALSGEEFATTDGDPLIRLGGLIQEDMVLLAKDGNGRYRLVAGCLCFPLHWNLPQKLGQPMAQIHEPVPGFAERLASPVDRFFAQMDPNRPVWRANWGLTAHAGLHLPDRSDRLDGIAPEEVGRRLYLRVERQTLRRLATSRHVVFGIRSLRCRMDDLLDDPAALMAMAERLREMPDPMLAYKGLLAIKKPVLAWIAQAVARRQHAPA